MPPRIIMQLAAVIWPLFVGAAANGEVTDSAANGFSINHSQIIDAERIQVFDSMIRDIGQWWSDDHTLSGFASNLYIESKVPGCFCERLPGDGGVVHMFVTFVNRGVLLRLTGGLGPLGLMGVNGNMTWEFADDEAGTRVTLQYAVGGYLQGGLDAIAPAVDAVLLEQLLSLKAHIESGAEEQ